MKLVEDDPKSTLKKDPPTRFYVATVQVPGEAVETGLIGESIVTVTVVVRGI